MNASVNAKEKALKFFAIAIFVMLWGSGKGQAVLFDFDNAPVHTSLPITLTSGSVTATFSATPPGYSIQAANTQGFTPPGFGGNCIYPNSINLADLFVRFDQPITDFSIMYSPQELGCDNSATMRVTAYMHGVYTGTNTKTASTPGTWPVDTLKYSFAQGFDSVVVHYDSRPPTCQDYGVIFMADNMWVTPLNSTGIDNVEAVRNFFVSNPVSENATVFFTLVKLSHISLTLYDLSGRLITRVLEGNLNEGDHTINWNAKENASVKAGIYILQLEGNNFSKQIKVVLF